MCKEHSVCILSIAWRCPASGNAVGATTKEKGGGGGREEPLGIVLGFCREREMVV